MSSRSRYLAIRPTVLLFAKTLLPLVTAIPIWSQKSLSALEDETPKDPSDPDLWIYLAVAVVLVLLGGVFAGLTIALMGQDETYLQVIATSGEGSERKHAAKVLKLLNRGKHWVLVTLLLSNVITNETLPIVLDRSLGGGWPAVLGSTVLIVIFGEIAPQSVCVRYGLSIGAFMAPFVLVLMWIMSPLGWPTAKLLDWLLGEDHGTTYKKAGLKTLVSLHKTLGGTPGERLMEDEVTIINSVLDLKDKPVGDIMTPMQDVFTMSADTVLDEPMMDTILSQGYSRIPIYAPDNQRNFIGMLLVKILITYDPEDAKRVRDFSLATLPETAPHTSCLDIINFFQEGKSHMVLVSDFPGQEKGATGVVTLEDVIEELIGEEIIDESDVFIDVHKAIRRSMPAPKQRFNRHPSLDTAAQDTDREDSENEPLLKKSSGSRKASLTNGNAPATTFLMRRKSSNASDSTRDTIRPAAVSVRSTVGEMRPNLRHLGPSNAASRPRPTKYTNVKIKPGVGTIPEGQATTKGVNGDSTPSATGSSNMDIPDSEDRVVKSAGKDAKDGAKALQQGYGTMSPDNTPRKRGMSTDGPEISPGQASKIAEQKANVSPPPGKVDNEMLKKPVKPVVVGNSAEDEDGDRVGPMTPSTHRSRSRRQARSGSITETTVDIGGVKKVVLETTSSSDEDEAGGGADGEDKRQGSGSSKDGGKR